jgi:hypothetical protein
MVQLARKGTSHSISSSCKYDYTSMSYGMATKCTKNSPCTNVPIHCPLCPKALFGQPRTIWKYKVMYHLAETHVDIGIDDTLPKIPGELLVNAFITSEEERLMGIEADLTAEFREENRIPDTDGIQELREVLKRTRAESTVSVDGRK